MKSNEVWGVEFSLPIDDPKREHCQHFNFVEVVGDTTGRNYGLYRILPTKTKRSGTGGSVTYECDHVISTLLDTVMDGYFQYTNHTTRTVLESLLAMQEAKHWRLGTVDFTRYFHYSFENENGLLAPVLSIPQPFDENFRWEYDTSSYPWTLHLLRADDAVKGEKRWGKDISSFENTLNTDEMVNYIIPKGYGEGVNQLTIKDVNGGRNYLKDDASIAKYGKIPYIWVDRRFKHADHLKESARSLLNQRKEPLFSFETNALDLSVLPEYAHEELQLNDVINVVVESDMHVGRISGIKIPDLSAEHDVDYTIANSLDDAADIATDIERKIEVNEAYSQGATNILSFNYQDNCDANIPAVIRFYIDDDVVNINTVELTFRTLRFRAYSRATEGGGALVKSTKGGGGTTESTTSGGGTTRSTTSGGATTQSTTAGGGTTTSSSSGGGTSTSTNSGGGSSQTSAAGGDHSHVMFNNADDTQGPILMRTFRAASGGLARFESDRTSLTTAGSSGNHSHSVSIPSHSHSFSTPNHTHSVTIQDHSHSVTIPSHSHDVTIPAHSHSVTIPDHTHEIEIPNHIHEVKHEIVELSNTPSRVTIQVDGNTVPHTSISGSRVKLADYLEKDDSGKITRGLHELSITPNGLARVEADLILRVFIQSQLGEVL